MDLRTPQKRIRRAYSEEKLHFDPQDTRCAIVTCGGFCPGLNTVVKNLVEILESRYGVEKIYGIKGGYRGFTSVGWDAPLGTHGGLRQGYPSGGRYVTRTSRGALTRKKLWSAETASCLRRRRRRIDGVAQVAPRQARQSILRHRGDGTHRGAYKLAELCWEKGVDVSVAGADDRQRHRCVTSVNPT